MRVENLLEFLNKTKTLSVPDYVVCDSELVDLLEVISVEEEFTRKIDLGIIYISEQMQGSTVLVDGLSRFLSLSLLLHAICECYKKTTPRNEKAIRIIRKKYLLNNTKTRLRLPKNMQGMYDKIIYGEKLSGKEKKRPMFILLHKYWQTIKENQLKASDIFKMLQKISITVVMAENIDDRDLYYSLNCRTKHINQILLIDDFLAKQKTKKIWRSVKDMYGNNDADLVLFFKDFFWNKFNFKEFNENKLYEYFVNYYETMRNYFDDEVIISKIKNSARLYLKLINVDMPNKELKQAMIKLKLHNCDETYAYLLSVFEDYTDGTLPLATFLEILSAIQEYLENREKTNNRVGFNELIQYLNAFIAYK